MILEAIISGALFITTVGILALIIFPTYRKLQANNEKIRQLKQDIKGLSEKKQKLDSLDMQTLAQYYTASKKALPEDINVGDIGEYINQVASEYGLGVVRLTISEESNFRFDINVDPDLELPLRRMSIPFVIKGEKKNLLQFLDKIQDTMPYTEFNQVQLGLSDSKWILRLTLLNYYLPYIQKLPITYKLPDINIQQLEKYMQQE